MVCLTLTSTLTTLAIHASFRNAFTHHHCIKKKYAALGVEIKSKRGPGIGMGRINEKDHMVQLVEDEEGNK